MKYPLDAAHIEFVRGPADERRQVGGKMHRILINGQPLPLVQSATWQADAEGLSLVTITMVAKLSVYDENETGGGL